MDGQGIDNVSDFEISQALNETSYALNLPMHLASRTNSCVDSLEKQVNFTIRKLTLDDIGPIQQDLIQRVLPTLIYTGTEPSKALGDIPRAYKLVVNLNPLLSDDVVHMYENKVSCTINKKYLSGVERRFRFCTVSFTLSDGTLFLGNLGTCVMQLVETLPVS
jgi:hypothetical protein